MKFCLKQHRIPPELYVDLYNSHYEQNIEMTIKLNLELQDYMQEMDKDLRWMMENRRKVTLQELETLILGKGDHYDT